MGKRKRESHFYIKIFTVAHTSIPFDKLLGRSVAFAHLLLKSSSLKWFEHKYALLEINDASRFKICSQRLRAIGSFGNLYNYIQLYIVKN